jgi:malate dehydrogenase (oxaloacetate-decarboxylating)(NADP+)
MTISTKTTKQDALEYHSQGRPGKIALHITKPCATQRDLTLAYSPGVAEPVRAIAADPEAAYRYTARGNLVAVVSNGTAVLGLGNVGPLAGKPVMEGKGVLFKRFADIDVFDIELDAKDPDEVVRVCKALAPTFGGINLEDIKAPDCFYIEETLRRELDIPVFHDDQHGTAIIAGAGLLNALEIVGKPLHAARLVINGAGASAIACANFFLRLGIAPENLIMCDSKGVIYQGRAENMNPYKEPFARPTAARTLADALQGADVVVGLSAAGAITPAMVQSMAPNPIIFALANPDPEITYEDAKAARPDAIVATGRSDYPNQVNNVLGFPFIFRGALDVRARDINEAMKVAAARALAQLAREDVPESVARLYGVASLRFGRDYIIPKALDPRVLTRVAPAVAQAAMESGAARLELDLDDYRLRLETGHGLEQELRRTFIIKARQTPKRVVLPEGEEPNIIRAALIIQKEGIGQPILIGQKAVISERLTSLGANTQPEVVEPASSPDLTAYAHELFALRQRKGLTRRAAFELICEPLYFAAMMVRKGEADAMVAGTATHTDTVIRQSLQVIGAAPGVDRVAGMVALILNDELFFCTDPVVNVDLTAEQLAQIAIMAADKVRTLGVEPRIAMLSFSNFGSCRYPEADKMRLAAELVKARRPELICDGEMRADTAIMPEILEQEYPFSDLTGKANLLVFPSMEAASIATHLAHRLAKTGRIGPMLLGIAKPVYVLSRWAETSEIVNAAAMAVAEAGEKR